MGGNSNGSTLILPGQPFGRREQNVQALSTREMAVIAQMHAVCQKHEIGLICPRCQTSFVGQNTGHERYMSITCKCRELRADMGALSGQMVKG